MRQPSQTIFTDVQQRWCFRLLNSLTSVSLDSMLVDLRLFVSRSKILVTTRTLAVSHLSLLRYLPVGTTRIATFFPSWSNGSSLFHFSSSFLSSVRPRSTYFDVSWRVFASTSPCPRACAEAARSSARCFSPSLRFFRSCFAAQATRKQTRDVLCFAHVDPMRHERDRRKEQNRIDPGSKGKV